MTANPEPVADDLVERLNTDAAYLRTRIAATLRTIANDCEQAAAALRERDALVAQLAAYKAMAEELASEMRKCIDDIGPDFPHGAYDLFTRYQAMKDQADPR